MSKVFPIVTNFDRNAANISDMPVRERVANINTPNSFDPMQYSYGIAPDHQKYPDHILVPPPRDQTKVPTPQVYKYPIDFHFTPLLDNGNIRRGNTHATRYDPKQLYQRKGVKYNANKARENALNVLTDSIFYPHPPHNMRQDYRYRTYPHQREYINGIPFFTKKGLRNVVEYFNADDVRGNWIMIALAVVLVCLYFTKK